MDRARHGIVDLHAHVLVDVDDGPRTPDEAAEVLTTLRQEGVSTVVATAHVISWAPNDPAALRRAFDRLAPSEAWPQVVLGAELNPGFLHDIRQAGLDGYTLGGSDVLLVEADPPLPLDLVGEAVEAAAAAGLRVLVAHPERHPDVRDDATAAAGLVERGALLQVTAAALAHIDPDAVDRFAGDAATAWELLERGLVHVVASDVHAIHVRPPRLAAAQTALDTRLGPRAADLLLRRNPRALLQSQGVTPVAAPLAGPRRG